jgi:hypothetical protein
MALSTYASALPSLTSHVNSSATIQWEQDGTQNGSSAHNHHSSNDFNGRGNFSEPFSVFHCWDNRNDRQDLVGAFGNGHCFINEDNANSRVRYRFTGAGWPAAASARVREAFGAFNSVTGTGNNETGIEFVETTGAAEIEVNWTNLPDSSGGGRYQFDGRIEMDSSYNWFFNRNPAGIVAGQWHFFSVVLHEIGHAVGFEHQTDLDLMTPTVGQPPNVAGARYFMGLDGDTIEGVRSLYSQPEAVSCNVALTSGTWITNNNNQQNFLYTVNSVGGSFSSIQVNVSNPSANSFQWQRTSGNGTWWSSSDGSVLNFTPGTQSNATFFLTANTNCGFPTRTITFYWY